MAPSYISFGDLTPNLAYVPNRDHSQKKIRHGYGFRQSKMMGILYSTNAAVSVVRNVFYAKNGDFRKYSAAANSDLLQS